MTTRIFLLDDHELVRRGLRDLLETEDDLEVAGEASTAEEALRRLPAARQDGSPPVRGMREWLGDVARPLAGVLGAAFDTRVHAPVPGSAARGESKRLRRLGVQLIAPATTFWVGGTPGPVLGGELDRARRWGEQLAHEVLAAHRPAGRP